MKPFRLKRDNFRRKRGGQAQLLRISCARCNAEILVYQKDGIGHLHRVYLDRIVLPVDLCSLHRASHVRRANDLKPLACRECGNVIGVPMEHEPGRLAYRLLAGTFHKARMHCRAR